MPTFNFTTHAAMWEQLKDISRETGKPISRIIREAIVEWLQKRGYTSAAGVA